MTAWQEDMTWTIGRSQPYQEDAREMRVYVRIGKIRAEALFRETSGIVREMSMQTQETLERRKRL